MITSNSSEVSPEIIGIKSSSERKIAANRANSLKSCGPITPEGKQTAARNSLRHGLLAQTPVLKGESLERFNYLRASLIELYQPRDISELTLIEKMAVAQWRQMRIWSLERAGLNDEIARVESHALPLDSAADTAAIDPASRAATAFRTLADNSRFLDTLGRYETRFERQYNRCLLLLNLYRGKGE